MRTLFILVTLLCIVLVPLSVRLYQARQQQLAVEWVTANGGYVHYDYQKQGPGSYLVPDSSLDKWLRNRLGDDFFKDVKLVSLKRKTKVEDIGPIRHFSQLKVLNLSKTQVMDLTPLVNLSKLEELDLSDTQVTDVRPLSGLPLLKKLRLNSPQMATVGSLSNLKILESLSITIISQEHLSQLAEFTCPLHLRFKWKAIDDLSELQNIPSVNSLSIYLTSVTELPSLAHMKQLGYLSISGSPAIAELPALPETGRLTRFRHFDSQVSDLRNLEKQIGLKELTLYGNNISDISSLAKLINLDKLTLHVPQVSDYSPLAQLAKLEQLALIDPELENLDSLSELKPLRLLRLSTSQVTRLTPLHQLTQLEQLTVNQMKIPETEIDQLKQALPKCAIFNWSKQLN
ncbi:MAG: leucine-rich repeat domain-containing protein [Pirellulales bacterium]